MVAMKAIRKLWQTHEMPRKRSIIQFKRHFSQAEFDRLSLGEVPQQMEDKWFISKTYGFSFIVVGLATAFSNCGETAEHGYDVVEAWVNREVEQYSSGA